MKAEKRHIRIRPRPFRVLGYLFWLAAMALMYLMFRSFLLLFFVCFLCLIPVLSIASGIWLAYRIDAGVDVPVAGYLRPGEDVSPVVKTYNPLWIGTLDVSMSLMIVNGFFGGGTEEDGLTVSLPAIGASIRGNRGVATLRMPFTATRIGQIRLSLTDCIVQDWFGLLKIHINPSSETSEASFVILPAPDISRQPDAESISAGLTEVEDSGRRGNDFSEVTDLREYIPGDRIRDIHWKASARRDEWMVKVRTQMAGMELNVVLLLDPDPGITEEIITRTYRELRGWSEGENDIRLRVYRTEAYGFDSFLLASPRDVDEAFAEILSSDFRTRIPADTTAAGLESVLKNRFPYMGGYVRFGVQPDGSIGWEPVEM